MEITEAEVEVNVLALKHEGVFYIGENFLKTFSSCLLAFEDGNVSSLSMIGHGCVQLIAMYQKTERKANFSIFLKSQTELKK